jgi:hypothetical protein
MVWQGDSKAEGETFMQPTRSLPFVPGHRKGWGARDV